VSGHRQAAVALHALTEADRAAILTHLPVADQGMLRGYLEELQALGFQSDGRELDALAATPGGLEAASASALFSVLEHEPIMLVAQVLALQDWCWKAELLALFPSARRELIRAAGAGVPAPARARFLRDALEAKLGRPVPARAAGAAPVDTLSARKWWRPWRR
jgi:hypothetical protein